MEGHIVIGTQMVEKAFNEQPTLYTEEFKARIKACIVQHHGKLEYGSPREPKTEEALILSIADNIDATMNKVQQIRDITPECSWSEYDKRINSKLFL
ncbi:3'-5' exoribonuclease YhaM [compost metagenome]